MCVQKTTLGIMAGRSSFSQASPPQTHILNYVLQMTNGSLIQFMNYVVVMVTLIKKQAPSLGSEHCVCGIEMHDVGCTPSRLSERRAKR